MYRYCLSLFFSFVLIGQVGAVDMPLTDIHGNETNLEAYQGRWVVVNYWATWCPPCIEEIPELQSFHDDHVDDNAMVIGMNVEAISATQLSHFLDTYFITYPVYVSGPELDSGLGPIPGLPTTFVVSPEGKLVARQIGSVTREMLEKFIQNQPAE